MPDAPTTPPSSRASGLPAPLAGLRVIDASTVLAGPYCTMVLADLGAEVIKIEPPEGDATRGWGPPWVGDLEAGTRTAAYFLAVNRNKRSLRLDLRTSDGKAILRRLLGGADLFVENFRPGALARLGFDDKALRVLEPRLVHVAISGYGPSGPAAHRPGYDFVIQAASGLMSITGQSDAVGGQPTKVGVAISDVVTGLFATVGALAGLLARPAGVAGGGQRIDVSLLGSTLAVLVNQAQNAFVSGVAPGRRGNAHPNIVPYETFATADGELAVAVGSERQWGSFCEAIDRPALADDPRFRTNGDRVVHRDALRPILAARFAEAGSATWVATLERVGVPCAPIADILQAFDSPEAAALDMILEMEHPAYGPLRQVASPIALTTTPAGVRMPPPTLGQDSDAILTELGLAPGEIARLRAAGII